MAKKIISIRTKLEKKIKDRDWNNKQKENKLSFIGNKRKKEREKKSIGDKPPHRQQRALHQITLHVMERLVWSSRGAIHALTRDKHASTTLLIKKMISRRENYQITLHVLYIYIYIYISILVQFLND